MKYLKYLRYVLVHKWHVFWKCVELGISMRGLLHDLSKFRLDEFIPYANYFYGNYPEEKKSEIEREFDRAWLKHIHRNEHHWQYWLLNEDDGGTKTLDMPTETIKEMVADWCGASAMFDNNPKEWYTKNQVKIKLSESSRNTTEFYLGVASE